MKYAFFGTPDFAAKILSRLIDDGMPPAALVCNPDRPVGRKHEITAPASKQAVLKSIAADKVKIFQPGKPAEIAEELRALDPDFFIVAAYAHILKADILSIPRLGTIGVHPSLLPKYRGASPIQSAILAGETETGVSLYKLGEGMDDGPVYETRTIPIGDMNYRELESSLAHLAGEMLSVFLPVFLNGTATSVRQAESQATLTRKFKTEDGFTDLPDVRAAESGDLIKSMEIYRKIRALSPEPGVWTIKNGKRIKLLNAQLENNRLRLLDIQKEGKVSEAYREGEL